MLKIIANLLLIVVSALLVLGSATDVFTHDETVAGALAVFVGAIINAVLD